MTSRVLVFSENPWQDSSRKETLYGHAGQQHHLEHDAKMQFSL